MSKQHTITLWGVISIYNEISEYLEGAIQLLKGKRIAWKAHIR